MYTTENNLREKHAPSSGLCGNTRPDNGHMAPHNLDASGLALPTNTGGICRGETRARLRIKAMHQINHNFLS